MKADVLRPFIVSIAHIYVKAYWSLEWINLLNTYFNATEPILEGIFSSHAVFKKKYFLYLRLNLRLCKERF